MSNQIRQMREQRGLSIRMLADLAGIGHSSLSRWERGEVAVPKSEFRRIAQLLGFLIESKPALELSEIDVSCETLKALRIQANLTLNEAAERLSVNRATICRWERALSHRGMVPLEEVIRAYELDLSQHQFDRSEPLSQRIVLLEQQVKQGGQLTALQFHLLMDELASCSDVKAHMLWWRARAAYVEWLAWWYHEDEAARLAYQHLNQLDTYPHFPVWGRFLRIVANYYAEQRADEPRATALLQERIDILSGHPSEAYVRRELCSHLLALRRFGEAEQELTKAESLRDDEAGQTAHLVGCQAIRARLYADRRQYQVALELMPEVSLSDPYLYASMMSEKAYLFYRIGNVRKTLEVLITAESEVRKAGYSHFAAGLQRHRKHLQRFATLESCETV